MKLLPIDYLSFSHLNMNLVVTTAAQTHEVILGVCAAFAYRKNVMDLLNGCVPSLLETHLTERVLRDISVADAFPCASVLFVHVGGSFVSIVILPCHFAVPLTVLTVCEFGTSGIRARPFRSRWHIFHLPGQKKSLAAYPRGFLYAVSTIPL